MWRSAGYHESVSVGSHVVVGTCLGYSRALVCMSYLNLKGKDPASLDEVLSMLLEDGRSGYSWPPDPCKVGIGSDGGGSPPVYTLR